MHAYTPLETDSTQHIVRFEKLHMFTHPDGTGELIRHARWERRPAGFPAFLWLYPRDGADPFLVDPNATLPAWLADTAPDWADR